MSRRRKLSAAQEADVLAWNTERTRLRHALKRLGTVEVKALELGISPETLRGYMVRGALKPEKSR